MHSANCMLLIALYCICMALIGLYCMELINMHGADYANYTTSHSGQCANYSVGC